MADQIAIDADLKAVVTGTRDKVAKKMEGLRVADAITEVFLSLIHICVKKTVIPMWTSCRNALR